MDVLIKGLNMPKDVYDIRIWKNGLVSRVEGYHLYSLQGVEAIKAPHGKWIMYPADAFCYHCSKCKHTTGARTNYCPNCGAKMDADVADKPYSPKCRVNMDEVNE